MGGGGHQPRFTTLTTHMLPFFFTMKSPFPSPEVLPAGGGWVVFGFTVARLLVPTSPPLGEKWAAPVHNKLGLAPARALGHEPAAGRLVGGNQRASEAACWSVTRVSGDLRGNRVGCWSGILEL